MAFHPIAWIFILISRMRGQICKNTRQSKENIGAAFGHTPPGRGAPQRYVFFTLHRVFAYVAHYPINQDDNLASRMISPIILIFLGFTTKLYTFIKLSNVFDKKAPAANERPQARPGPTMSARHTCPLLQELPPTTRVCHNYKTCSQL